MEHDLAIGIDIDTDEGLTADAAPERPRQKNSLATDVLKLKHDAGARVDEWLDVSVDLSQFAGRRIKLFIENQANNWHNEWAYWNTGKVLTE